MTLKYNPMENYLDCLEEIYKHYPLSESDAAELGRFEKKVLRRLKGELKLYGYMPTLSFVSKNGNTLGHLAALCGFDSIANLIINRPEACFINNSNVTMAHIYVNQGNEKMAIKCLKNKELTSVKAGGLTFVELAMTKSGFNSLLNLACDDEDILRTQNQYREHLGFSALRTGRTRLAVKIVENHPEVAKLKNIDGDTMGHIAYDELNLPVLRAVLSNRTLRRIQNRSKQSVMHLVCMTSKTQRLISPEVAKDAPAMTKQDCFGNTPAHYLVSSNNIALSNAAIKLKNACQIENKNGDTLLDIARANGTLLSIANFPPEPER